GREPARSVASVRSGSRQGGPTAEPPAERRKLHGQSALDCSPPVWAALSERHVEHHDLRPLDSGEHFSRWAGHLDSEELGKIASDEREGSTACVSAEGDVGRVQLDLNNLVR